MKKTTGFFLLMCLLTAPTFAAPAYPLDKLLLRAKFVCVADVESFDGSNVVLDVQTKLRGDPGMNRLRFKVDAAWGLPKKAQRYFLFSQGHDHWGEPKDEIKLRQGHDGQGSYCGWLMLPINTVNGIDQVHNAYTSQYRIAGEGRRPLALAEAMQLVKDFPFKAGEKGPNQAPEDTASTLSDPQR